MGKPRGAARLVDPVLIRRVSDETGSVNRAAKTAGAAFSVARRILVADGLIPAAALARGRRRGRHSLPDATDWRVGIRRSAHSRIRPDGTVVNYRTGTRYKTSGARDRRCRCCGDQ